MNIVPAYLRKKNDDAPLPPRDRPRAPALPAELGELDPAVVNFLQRHREIELDRDALERENADYRQMTETEISRLRAENHEKTQTIINQEQTIRELTARADRMTQEAIEMRTRITTIGQACHDALAAAEKSRASFDQSVRLNEEPLSEREERRVRELGERLGAGFDNPDEERAG